MDTSTHDVSSHSATSRTPKHGHQSEEGPRSKSHQDKIREMPQERRPVRPAAPFFVTRCEARLNDAFFPSNGLTVAVGQLIRQNGIQKVWDSILLRCEEESDGTLAIRVLIANPDWEQLLQIACVRSRPHDPESLTPLACNLDHEDLPA